MISNCYKVISSMFSDKATSRLEPLVQQKTKSNLRRIVLIPYSCRSIFCLFVQCHLKSYEGPGRIVGIMEYML